MLLTSSGNVWVSSYQMIHVFSLPDSAKIASLAGHSSMVHSLIQVKDKIWSCSSDKTIKIWTLEVCLSISRIFFLHRRNSEAPQNYRANVFKPSKDTAAEYFHFCIIQTQTWYGVPRGTSRSSSGSHW